MNYIYPLKMNKKEPSKRELIKVKKHTIQIFELIDFERNWSWIQFNELETYHQN